MLVFTMRLQEAIFCFTVPSLLIALLTVAILLVLLRTRWASPLPNLKKRHLPRILPFSIGQLDFVDARSLTQDQLVRAHKVWGEEFLAIAQVAIPNPEIVKLCERDGIDAEVLRRWRVAYDADNSVTLEAFVASGGSSKYEGEVDPHKTEIFLIARRGGRFVGGISFGEMRIERDDTLIRVTARARYGIKHPGDPDWRRLGRHVRWFIENDLVTAEGKPNVDIVELTLPANPAIRWSTRRAPAVFGPMFEELGVGTDRTDFTDGTGDPRKFRRKGVA